MDKGDNFALFKRYDSIVASSDITSRLGNYLCYSGTDDGSGITGIIISIEIKGAGFQIKASINDDIYKIRKADFNGVYGAWRLLTLT